MAQVTMEITGHMADAKAGDRVWVLDRGRDGLPTERTIISVDYEHDNPNGVWQVDGFKVTTVPDPDAPEEYYPDDWDWIHRDHCFATEKEALEQKQVELAEDVQDKEQELADLHRLQHRIQRRLLALAAEDDPFESE